MNDTIRRETETPTPDNREVVTSISRQLLEALNRVVPPKEHDEEYRPDALEKGYRLFVLRLLAYAAAELEPAARRSFLENPRSVIELLRSAIEKAHIHDELRKVLTVKLEILKTDETNLTFVRILKEFQMLIDGSPMTVLETEMNARLAIDQAVGSAYSYLLLSERNDD